MHLSVPRHPLEGLSPPPAPRPREGSRRPEDSHAKHPWIVDVRVRAVALGLRTWNVDDLSRHFGADGEMLTTAQVQLLMDHEELVEDGYGRFFFTAVLEQLRTILHDSFAGQTVRATQVRQRLGEVTGTMPAQGDVLAALDALVTRKDLTPAQVRRFVVPELLAEAGAATPASAAGPRRPPREPEPPDSGTGSTPDTLEEARNLGDFLMSKFAGQTVTAIQIAAAVNATALEPEEEERFWFRFPALMVVLEELGVVVRLRAYQRPTWVVKDPKTVF